jgi:glucosamine-6-phosphate deaminase
MKTLQCDALHVYACDTRAEMGALAAARCVHYIKELLAKKEEINMIFAAAPSQNEMLDALVASDVDFSRINAFHMDEYVGLSPGTPQTFGYYVTEHLFSRVKFKSVHIINTASGADAACAEYAALLWDSP